MKITKLKNNCWMVEGEVCTDVNRLRFEPFSNFFRTKRECERYAERQEGINASARADHVWINTRRREIVEDYLATRRARMFEAARQGSLFA